MKRQKVRRAVTTLVLLLLALTLLPLTSKTVAYTEPGDEYHLTWFTVDGGGGHSSGGEYALSGSIAQPDAGRLNGGEYNLDGGFWHSSATNAEIGYRIYLPSTLRGFNSQ